MTPELNVPTGTSLSLPWRKQLSSQSSKDQESVKRRFGRELWRKLGGKSAITRISTRRTKVA